MGNDHKNETVMLEQQITRDDGPIKPIPIVEKTDYSGAHEVESPHNDVINIHLTFHLENRPSRNRTRQKARQVDYAHAVVDVLA
jgi:hypothetical protein